MAAKGQAPPAALSMQGDGISRNTEKFSACVCDHLNALQLSISVHQRCYVAFKMHQIYIRLGLRPIRTLGSYPHSLVSLDLRDKDGRQDERLPRAPQTLAPPLLIGLGKLICVRGSLTIVIYYVFPSKCIMILIYFMV